MQGSLNSSSGKKIGQTGFTSSYQFSDSRSIRTTGGGLANRLTGSLSKVAWNCKVTRKDGEENKFDDIDEDLAELQQMIDEFNVIIDLTVKLNSQIKICKIIELNDDYAYGETTKKTLVFDSLPSIQSVRAHMDQVLNKLQELAKAKDKEVEEYLEEFASEKVQ
jgi:hypothetical protein